MNNRNWLAGAPWEMVVWQNEQLCKSKLARHGPHSTGMRKVKTYEIPPKDKP
jgi:hypothetical protein